MARLTAPALSFLLLGAVVVLAVLHYATLLGVASGSPASGILPRATQRSPCRPGWAAILRSRRPHIYATIGLGANAVTAQSTAVPGALS